MQKLYVTDPEREKGRAEKPELPAWAHQGALLSQLSYEVHEFALRRRKGGGLGGTAFMFICLGLVQCCALQESHGGRSGALKKAHFSPISHTNILSRGAKFENCAQGRWVPKGAETERTLSS